ncbi:hypothetical protein L0668_06755 [Paraglaciecola aquimarina]|uniref:HEAT repeat domain-containing protein n=1 Tax=Paraglaciecola algarum TaxID=3050085 RepID=A0ABS9D6Y8_9ALTE|nr:hypothetical protein [Paraglaciecola sp. G1-23]MCF2947798.1 hypothetical protein [Paraglaciecola sp. G1-23]
MLRKIVLLCILALFALGVYLQWFQHKELVKTAATSVSGPGNSPTEHAQTKASQKKPSQSNATEQNKPNQTAQQVSQTPVAAKVEASVEFIQARQILLTKLTEIQDCENNGLCPGDEQDPKQNMFQQEAMFVQALKQLQEMHQAHQVFDSTLSDITGKYLTSPLGRVQMQAIDMLAKQPKNEKNAEILISALSDSYDSKVMAKAMPVLANYPQQQKDYEDMLVQTLKTGSFYVSRTVAKEVRHILTKQNIAKFEALAASLPDKTAKTKILKTSIADFKRAQQ